MFEGILQPTHLLLILAIVLIVFGPGKLPGLGKAIGESVRELRKSTQDLNDTVNSQTVTTTEPAHVVIAPVAPVASATPVATTIAATEAVKQS